MINMLKNLMGKISHINEEMQNFNREMKPIKKIQKEILEMENTSGYS